jgi:hypothetical protein
MTPQEFLDVLRAGFWAYNISPKDQTHALSELVNYFAEAHFAHQNGTKNDDGLNDGLPVMPPISPDAERWADELVMLLCAEQTRIDPIDYPPTTGTCDVFDGE